MLCLEEKPSIGSHTSNQNGLKASDWQLKMVEAATFLIGFDWSKCNAENDLMGSVLLEVFDYGLLQVRW